MRPVDIHPKNMAILFLCQIIKQSHRLFLVTCIPRNRTIRTERDNDDLAESSLCGKTLRDLKPAADVTRGLSIDGSVWKICRKRPGRPQHDRVANASNADKRRFPACLCCLPRIFRSFCILHLTAVDKLLCIFCHLLAKCILIGMHVL